MKTENDIEIEEDFDLFESDEENYKNVPIALEDAKTKYLPPPFFTVRQKQAFVALQSSVHHRHRDVEFNIALQMASILYAKMTQNKSSIGEMKFLYSILKDFGMTPKDHHNFILPTAPSHIDQTFDEIMYDSLIQKCKN